MYVKARTLRPLSLGFLRPRRLHPRPPVLMLHARSDAAPTFYIIVYALLCHRLFVMIFLYVVFTSISEFSSSPFITTPSLRSLDSLQQPGGYSPRLLLTGPPPRLRPARRHWRSRLSATPPRPLFCPARYSPTHYSRLSFNVRILTIISFVRQCKHMTSLRS